MCYLQSMQAVFVSHCSLLTAVPRWRVQAVTVEGQAFENRLSLPEEWRGVRDQDLAKVTG